MKCTICEEELNEEEINSPYKAKDGNIICDECFKLRYTHTCPLCENCFDEDFTKGISPKYLLISNYAAEHVNARPGIYEIVKYPFYDDWMITITMLKTSMNRIADLPDSFNEQDFYSDIFYVCDACVNNLTQEK